MTQIIDRLVARELLERNQDEDDRRRYLIRLTGAGRLRLAEYNQKVRRALSQKLAGLEPAEVEGLAAALKTIIDVTCKLRKE